MKTYSVSVSVGEDDVRDYAIEADTEEIALNIGVEYVRDLVGGYVDGEVEGPEDAGDDHLTIDDLGPEGRAIVEKVAVG